MNDTAPHSPACGVPRALVFRDSQEGVGTWEPGAGTPDDEAFLGFLDAREGPANWVFTLEDPAAGDGIMLAPSQAWLSRGRPPAQPGEDVTPERDVEFALLMSRPQLEMLVAAYVDGGYAGLDDNAVWMSDVDDLMRAVSDFADAQAKARERKLMIRDGAGHRKAFTFTFERGSRSNLQFVGAVQAFLAKHLSEENSSFSIECPAAEETLVVETATNVLTRTRGGEDPRTTHTRVEDYYAGSDLWHRFAISGYPGLDDRADWSEDLGSVLPEGPVENHHLNRVREREEAERRRKEIRAMPKLDRKSLRRFCQAWGDHGYTDYSGEDAVYVMFEGWSLEEAGAQREEILAAIGTMELQVLHTPAGASEAEIRVAADPRIDLELEKWS